MDGGEHPITPDSICVEWLLYMLWTQCKVSTRYHSHDLAGSLHWKKQVPVQHQNLSSPRLSDCKCLYLEVGTKMAVYGSFFSLMSFRAFPDKIPATWSNKRSTRYLWTNFELCCLAYRITTSPNHWLLTRTHWLRKTWSLDWAEWWEDYCSAPVTHARTYQSQWSTSTFPYFLRPLKISREPKRKYLTAVLLAAKPFLW